MTEPYLLSSGVDAAEIILVPGIRAGLNDRSQSAYAAPAPNPVVSAIGHARPVIFHVSVGC